MAQTPKQVAAGAASFVGSPNLLASIIYLLNTNNMTAEQIAAGAAPFVGIPNKESCIIYLLTQFTGGGGGGGGFSYGTVNPTNGTTTGGFYVNTAAGTGWVSQTNGATWTQIF